MKNFKIHNYYLANCKCVLLVLRFVKITINGKKVFTCILHM